jgi:hypothetical protein
MRQKLSLKRSSTVLDKFTSEVNGPCTLYSYQIVKRGGGLLMHKFFLCYLL